MIPVWDRFVRLFHWTLALSFAVAWLSSEHLERLHDAAGYVAGALVRRPSSGVSWAALCPLLQFRAAAGVRHRLFDEVATGAEPRFIGHNPAGGAMILVLLAASPRPLSPAGC